MKQLFKYFEKKGPDEENVIRALDIIHDIKERYITPVSMEDSYATFSSENVELKGRIHSLLNGRFWFRGFADSGNLAVFMVEVGSGNIARGLRDANFMEREGFYVTEQEDHPKTYAIKENNKEAKAYYSDFACGRISIPLTFGDQDLDDSVALLRIMLKLSEDSYLSKP